MPTYCYRRLDNDEPVEVFMTFKQHNRRQRRDGTIRLPDGTRAMQDLAAQHGGFHNTPGNWPMSSVALGCSPEEVPAVRAAYIKRGINNPQFVIKNEGAELVFNDRKHRKETLKTLGHWDADGGYGD